MTTQNKNSPTDKTKNKPYVFVQRDKDDFSCIKITEGKFKDVIYHYGKVGFAKEENSKGQLPMKFDYNVIKKPNDVDTLDNQEFIDYIGDILTEVMEEQLNNGTLFKDWTDYNR